MREIITDTLVDIICEKSISPRPDPDGGVKRGFFLKKPYLPSRTTLKGRRPLIDRRFVDKEIKRGERVIKVPRDAIITPLARLLIDEKGVRIEKC